jgi:hypothetical protein
MRLKGGFVSLFSFLFGEKKKGKRGEPERLTIKTRFNPIRLSSFKKNHVDLILIVENVGGKEALVSVDVLLSSDAMVGFDESAIQKKTNVRLGVVKPMSKVVRVVTIFANTITKPGEIPINLKLFVHGSDYAKVLYFHEKNIKLRCV